MVQQASQVLCQRSYVRTLVCRFTREVINDIENGDPCSFTPMIMNKDDDVVDDIHATHKDHNEGIYI